MPDDTITVHTPVEGFTGEVAGVEFTDGTADVPEDHPSLGYFRRRGYGIGKPAAVQSPPATGPAANTHQNVVGGGQLRDAAADPKPGDNRKVRTQGDVKRHGKARE